MESPTLWLANICRKNGLHPTDSQLHLLEQYVALLLEWNKKINLISRKDEEQVWANHILHSISVLFKLRLREDAHILDLGTGGGLPGVPLKILMPNSTFLLLDATRKKVSAVQDMVDKLGLHGVETLWGRAEEVVEQENLVSHFDYIVTRAVATLTDLVSWSAPFLRHPHPAEPRPPGHEYVSSPALIALKGGNLEEELSKMKQRGAPGDVDVIGLVFPGSEEIAAVDKKIVVVHF